jgi:cytochrome c oxidase subunit 2
MSKLLGLPELASKHGQSLDNLAIYVHLLMAVLFVGWLGYFFYVLCRFRSTRNPKPDHQGVRNHFSNWIEGGVALVEAVLLVGFAIPLWALAVERFPTEDVVELKVVGRQFNWTTRYPGIDGRFGRQDVNLISPNNEFGLDRTDPAGQDDFDTFNEMRVPVNRNIIADITSLDVIHSFMVHAMRVAQDATPGLGIPVWFKPVKEGRYMITCAQLCGNSHYSMKAELWVVGQEEYDQWAEEKSAEKKAQGAPPVSYE